MSLYHLLVLVMLREMYPTKIQKLNKFDILKDTCDIFICKIFNKVYKKAKISSYLYILTFKGLIALKHF